MLKSYKAIKKVIIRALNEGFETEREKTKDNNLGHIERHALIDTHTGPCIELIFWLGKLIFFNSIIPGFVNFERIFL